MVFSDKEIHLKDTNVQEYIVHNASWNELLINSWMNIQYLLDFICSSKLPL